MPRRRFRRTQTLASVETPCALRKTWAVQMMHMSCCPSHGDRCLTLWLSCVRSQLLCGKAACSLLTRHSSLLQVSGLLRQRSHQTGKLPAPEEVQSLAGRPAWDRCSLHGALAGVGDACELAYLRLRVLMLMNNRHEQRDTELCGWVRPAPTHVRAAPASSLPYDHKYTLIKYHCPLKI